MFPLIGYGLGLRRPHYQHVMSNPTKVDWWEIISENFMPVKSGWGDPALSMLDKLRETYPLVLHGVSLSLGSSDPLNKEYLNNLKLLIDRYQPVLVSDHLCWGGVDGQYLHDLLPLPYTQSTSDWVADRIQQVQNFLGRRILIENVSSYLSYECSEMIEWEFLNDVVKKADCGILLDVNNVYVSSVNHSFSPYDFLDSLPAERIGQIHLAGHCNQNGFLVDTHNNPICDDVWNLYHYTIKRIGLKNTNIERDDNIPEFSVLEDELQKARLVSMEAQNERTIATI